MKTIPNQIVGKTHPALPRDQLMKDRMRSAAILLAQGKTCRFVAQQLNVSEKTIWNYRQNPRVQKIIRDCQEEFTDMSGSMAVTVVPEAISVLQGILHDGEARASDRIQAARTLMAGSQAYQEKTLLQREISDLKKELMPTMVDVDVMYQEDDDE